MQSGRADCAIGCNVNAINERVAIRKSDKAHAVYNKRNGQTDGISDAWGVKLIEIIRGRKSSKGDTKRQKGWPQLRTWFVERRSRVSSAVLCRHEVLRRRSANDNDARFGAAEILPDPRQRNSDRAHRTSDRTRRASDRTRRAFDRTHRAPEFRSTDDDVENGWKNLYVSEDCRVSSG